MWIVYYPSLAIARVPSVLPHTNGAILNTALTHIVTPRVFFPDKPDLMSDSDKVRKYSNMRVAGRESNTSIAFGYAAEAYIDFGIPVMFVPVFCFGLFLGVMYAFFRSIIWHRELFGEGALPKQLLLTERQHRPRPADRIGPEERIDGQEDYQPDDDSEGAPLPRTIQRLGWEEVGMLYTVEQFLYGVQRRYGGHEEGR